MIEQYEEMPDKSSKVRVLRSLAGDKPGIWDGQAITSPYHVMRKYEIQRAAALASSDTLYCYDYLDLFREACRNAWAEKEAQYNPAQAGKLSGPPRPVQLMDYVELVVTVKGTEPPMYRGEGSAWDPAAAEAGMCEREVQRPMGQNDVGMVAWLVTLRTPEYPEGRQMVLISNDITFVQGSFGTREDWVFKVPAVRSRAQASANLPRGEFGSTYWNG